jgi:hypothetical protein
VTNSTKIDNNTMRFDLELIRIVSAFGIVWFHSGIDSKRDVAYSGLVFFVVLSAYFATTSKKEHKISERVLKFLVPYFIWSALYALFNLIRGVDIFPENYSIINATLASTSIHLWYLPFIFFCILAIDAAKEHCSKNIMGLFSGIAALVFIATAPEWKSLSYMPPWGQYAHALPAFLVGIFLGCFGEIKRFLRNVILFGIYAAVMVMLAKGVSGIGVTYSIGLTTCLLFLKKDSIIGRSNAIYTLSTATFGVYLIHIITLFVVRHFGVTGFLLPLLSYIISVSGVVAVRNYFPSKIVKYVL